MEDTSLINCEQPKETIRRCEVCNGDDQESPCAYPGGSMMGCLRNERLRAMGFTIDDAFSWLVLDYNLIIREISVREKEGVNSGRI
jgi:hypothetical protein